MHSRLKILLYNKALNTLKQSSKSLRECNWLLLRPGNNISCEQTVTSPYICCIDHCIGGKLNNEFQLGN